MEGSQNILEPKENLSMVSSLLHFFFFFLENEIGFDIEI